MSDILKLEGDRAVIDCSLLGMELGSPEFVSHHLKLLSALGKKPKTIRYEEEIVINLDEDKTQILNEYIDLLRQFEGIMIKPDIYGDVNDDNYSKRKQLLRKVYSYLTTDPLHANELLEGFNEPTPEKNAYIEGWQVFKAWVNGITRAIKKTRFFQLCKTHGGIQSAFGELIGMKGAEYFSTSMLFLPKDAIKLEEEYVLEYGIVVNFYEIPDKDMIIYVQRNKTLENLDPKLKEMLRETIIKGIKDKSVQSGDIRTVFDEVWRELKIQFLDTATLRGITITNLEAEIMAREAVSWLAGMGSPIENMTLDEYITDAYIDAQNAPIYIDHSKYGIIHTLWRYNEDMIETMFANAIYLSGQERKFDESNPVVDVVVKRINMRCHLQRPPATFNELQAALRIMRTKPFTYPLYLKYKSMSPFFSGYDALLVWLGTSEAVLGVKGVGKTAFTSAKISAIGQKKRILPIQDIEEMPISAYRKLGFHVGTLRVQSSETEGISQTGVRGAELDLVTIANASLRMGEACLIINEIRSRVAIQGVINILNTQPGVFILYNLHAESLQDVQDRLELVFGIPSASMYSTDRYSFLVKLRFGRKERTYRVLGSQFESDFAQKKFVKVFEMNRGVDIDTTKYLCSFLDTPEASMNSFENLNFEGLREKIKFRFVPPLLDKYSKQNGINAKDYIMEAFFRGKVYDDIRRTAEQRNDPLLMEIEFVMKCNSLSSRLVKENEKGVVDYAKVAKQWKKEFEKLVEKEIKEHTS
ncbi:Flp pilus assembly complex ATPase component TadA [Candidatus Micrarchaeota archaeon]|nr:Flp pilus assembly complex ATPase component TadA [Candidatus Micrarchaeota archaeon]